MVIIFVVASKTDIRYYISMKTEIIAAHDIREAYAIHHKCFALYLSTHEEYTYEQLVKCVPWLVHPDAHHLMYDCNVMLVFPNERKAREAYDQVVGDDGATKTNPYDGPLSVYACLYGPKGCITENT